MRPTSAQLATYTAQVKSNFPEPRRQLDKAHADSITKEVFPKIKHVLYIIRENRTYDQVLGDLGKGNGDPNLTLFGEEVTPNAHKLARETVILDNLYCNGEVSQDGHQWSNAAYATDLHAEGLGQQLQPPRPARSRRKVDGFARRISVGQLQEARKDLPKLWRIRVVPFVA